MRPFKVGGLAMLAMVMTAIAVPDLRGSGDAQRLMDPFNATLFRELQTSGQLKLIPKTVYPLQVPQQPSDLHAPVSGRSQGPWLTDWSGPPVNANYLAFGYTAVQNNQLVLYGWLDDVTQTNTSLLHGQNTALSVQIFSNATSPFVPAQDSPELVID